MSNIDNINKAQKELADKILKTFKGTAISTSNKVIIATPKDTGRAQHNWQASINTPATGELLGTSIVPVNYTRVKITDSLLLTNNLPYIQPLADGHSTQRPAGWIDTIVLNMNNAFQTEIKKYI